MLGLHKKLNSITQAVIILFAMLFTLPMLSSVSGFSDRLVVPVGLSWELDKFDISLT